MLKRWACCEKFMNSLTFILDMVESSLSLFFKPIFGKIWNIFYANSAWFISLIKNLNWVQGTVSSNDVGKLGSLGDFERGRP